MEAVFDPGDKRGSRLAARQGSAEAATPLPGRCSCCAPPKAGPARRMVDGLEDRGHLSCPSGAGLPKMRTGTPNTCGILEDWLRSYEPGERYSMTAGRFRGELRRPGAGRATPHGIEPARQWRGADRPELVLPDHTGTSQSPLSCSQPRRTRIGSTRRAGPLSVTTCYRDNAAARSFRLFCPDETNSNRLDAVFDISPTAAWMEGIDPAKRRPSSSA